MKKNEVKVISMNLKRKVSAFLLCAAAALFQIATAPSAFADPILGSDLASFAVLGATPAVTNTGATTITGNLGVSPAASITGKATITVNGTPAIGNPAVHEADALAGSAQSQLGIAMTNLGLLGAGTLEPADLVGLTLYPGVYTVPYGVSNLTGVLTLDGLGDVNAFWVFQMGSSLITSTGSVVNVTNTGSGAGLYWNVRSSATLNSGTTFEGNILALASITMGDAVTIGCGRALAHTGTVTMIHDTISTGCTTDLGGSTTLLAGSNGLSGSGGGTPIVPEPGTLPLLSTGLAAGSLLLRKFRSMR